ncbi:dTDP-4-dehydrorhamnose 3,5-epimerase [Corynebacterium choanae]|uniref:dTDP-4-dehydrorhamnose 3,5-epimerase n=1 Tax=Corynebacterium choanae TaxID=1862358 RepID=A0A3G6JE97_9CORY|nr:dTDP-4-dehydrorhamnose 3,5-epimerase [Corynebacterium choanae]AZA14464.1 dTDP-4-dehydrorhamnose 3,5-epimerase [Corynebacterium choanae]
MLARDTILPDVLISTPQVHPDERGSFAEWFKTSEFIELTGYPFGVEQANVSVSREGVIRGLHFAELPPGQAKWVHCAAGTILDVIVDIRSGSPTFGKHTTVELSAENRKSVFVPDGFAHGFAAITDATVMYLTTAEYNPVVEHGINPFDPTLNIAWPAGMDILSEKDRFAPAFQDFVERELLPDYETAVETAAEMRALWADAEDNA